VRGRLPPGRTDLGRVRENRPYQWRDLDGKPITREQARAIAVSLAVDPETRQRLRQQRGPDASHPRQPEAPHDHDRPSPDDLTVAVFGSQHLAEDVPTLG
jgi:hypothetical protein